jgi:hypothetical protein
MPADSGAMRDRTNLIGGHMAHRGTRSAPALVAVIVLSGLLAACGNNSTPSATDTTAPSSAPATTSVAGSPPDFQPALEAYKKFLTAQQTLNMVNTDQRAAHLQPYATGEALTTALRLKKLEEDETGIQFFGNPISRPQAVAWGDKGITIFDCQDNSTRSQTLSNGKSLGAISNQLVITLMTTNQAHEWKASTYEPSQGRCISPEAYNTTTPPTYPPHSLEADAVDAYKKYWEIGYSLVNYPEAQRKNLLAHYATGNPLKDSLDDAKQNEKEGYRNVSGPSNYPVVIENFENAFRIYDCTDDSTSQLVDKKGNVTRGDEKRAPLQAMIELIDGKEWKVTDIVPVIGECK